ncbi:MAG: prephenate dehydrogenase/arogenate dehydrogenase family protein [Acidobacteria bacterium]|jgi:prephenate dehydrogenase|nr:MAG: prephenate dehydrogenase/arogenate dehydrogenase family protein [Acidobacteriota bacterium]
MFERVGVIGVGFMGGSFALACKESAFCKVFGVDINPEAIRKGKELGVIDEGSTRIEDLKEFDTQLVVIATPVRTFYSIGKALREILDESCVVSDIGSVKGHLVYALEDFLGPRFVGAHPIAGTEKAGVENVLKGLYRGKKCIITPTERTDREAKKKVVQLWESFGSLVEEMDPYLHDHVFGAVSHLPHAVAFALMETIEALSQNSVDLFKYPGAGFKDFTRIAASDPVMWRDIFLENSNNLDIAIEAFINAFSRLRRLIKEKREDELTQYLRSASYKRKSLD